MNQLGQKSADYNLPFDFKEFRRLLKKMSIRNNDGYKMVINDLVD